MPVPPLVPLVIPAPVPPLMPVLVPMPVPAPPDIDRPLLLGADCPGVPCIPFDVPVADVPALWAKTGEASAQVAATTIAVAENFMITPVPMLSKRSI